MADMVWQTVNDGDVCEASFLDSCEPRNGKVMSPEEWDSFGWPGTPQLLCSIFSKGPSRCRCVLLPADAEGQVTSINAAEAIAAGRDRARKEINGNS